MRVNACGICGSDLHSYTTGAFIKPGQVMGHEFSGEVVEVGARALYEESVHFNPSRLVWGEVKLVGTFGYRNEFPQAIELLQSGKVNTVSLITDTFALERTNDGFQRQLDKERAMKVMIRPS